MNNFNFDLDATADEDFFGTLRSKSSKLQQLLDEDTLPQAEKQLSLKYQRPKATDLIKPQKNETSSNSPAPAGSRTSTLMAKVVTAYRQVELQGKVGVALVKTAEDSLQVVIYKSKEKLLATLQLLNDRQTLFKQERYWQFYDDTTEVDWSFCFDSTEDEVEFQDLLVKTGQTYKVNLVDKKEKERSEDSIEELRDTSPSVLNGFENMGLSKTLSTAEAAKAKDLSKTSLIKRMAKVGQPLPNLSTTSMQTTTEFSDSSDTEIITTPLSLPQKPSIAPRNNKLATLKANQKQLIPTTMAFNAAPVYSTISNNLESQYMQMLLTEQRTQGSELRMNINKLETKIEKVLDKLDNCDRGAMGESQQKKHKDDEILELEEKILNLKKENRKLKQTIEDTKEKETYEVKSKKLLGELKDDLIELNLEECNDVEQIIKKCLNRIQDERDTIQKQQELIRVMEKNKKETENSLEKQKESHKSLDSQLQDLKEKDVQHKLQQHEKDKQLKSQEQQIQELQQDLKDKSKENLQTSTDALVKSIMNNLFDDICIRMANSDCRDKEKAMSLVGLSIRQQTLKALQQQKSGE